MPSATSPTGVSGRVDRVLVAEPRGFCAGVEMAIKALTWLVRAFDEPVYCYHEIVHNKLVVERFEAQGVVFVDDIDDVPDGAPLMLSAHGSAPDIAGRGIANPIAAIWSAAMMLEHLGQEEASAAIVTAIEKVIKARDVKTSDMGGKATTAELGKAVEEAL